MRKEKNMFLENNDWLDKRAKTLLETEPDKKKKSEPKSQPKKAAFKF